MTTAPTLNNPASSLTDLFQPPSDSVETERTSLLTPKSSPLHDLFQPPSESDEVLEVPIKGDDEKEVSRRSRPKAHKITLSEIYQNIITPDCLKSTFIGSFVFVLFHIVFCLAQASAISRPHATSPVVGPVAKMAALGILAGSPIFVAFLGNDIPAIYPTSDLFLAPFLSNLALTIDDVLYQDGLENDNGLFLATFTLVSSSGLLLSAVMCVLAARFKLANLGAFLPYSVLCGFFSTIGILMWTLAFSVDNDGKKIGQVVMSGDWGLVGHSLVHHAPSLCIGE